MPLDLTNNYKPKFNTSLTREGLNGTVKIHPRYALDYDSAAILAGILTAVGGRPVEVIDGPPSYASYAWQLTNIMEQPNLVPWLQFYDTWISPGNPGTRINAAELASMWVGTTPKRGLLLAIRDYQRNAHDQGYGDDPGPFPVNSTDADNLNFYLI